MDVLEAIQKRRSIRQFKKNELSEELVEIIVEAARMAPSAGNGQPVDLVVVKDQGRKEQLSLAAFGQKQIMQAPVVFVVCADEKRAAEKYGERGRKLYCIQDTAAATMNIMLSACSLGLGTCWIGAFKENEVKEVVNAPENMRPVVMIPMGYPNESPLQRSRRPLDEIVHKETF